MTHNIHFSDVPYSKHSFIMIRYLEFRYFALIPKWLILKPQNLAYIHIYIYIIYIRIRLTIYIYIPLIYDSRLRDVMGVFINVMSVFIMCSSVVTV